MSDFALYRSVPASRALWRPSLVSRAAGAVRYAGVLAVWAMLFIVRPEAALRVFRERRADSPLRRTAARNWR